MEVTIRHQHNGEERTETIDGVTRIEEVQGGGDYHELHVWTGPNDMTIYSRGELV